MHSITLYNTYGDIIQAIHNLDLDYVAGYMAAYYYISNMIRNDTDLSYASTNSDLSSYLVKANSLNTARDGIYKTYGVWIKSPLNGFNLYQFDNTTFITGVLDVCKGFNYESKYIITDTVFDKQGNIVLLLDGQNSNIFEYRAGSYIQLYDDVTDELNYEMYDENVLEPFRNNDL